MTVSNACGSDVVVKNNLIEVIHIQTQAQVMHVNDMRIETGKWWVFYAAYAYVQVVDETGGPVANATVYGEWVSDVSNAVTFKTNADGWGSIRSKWRWVNGNFKFCVSNLVKTDWTYDAAANEMTCTTSGGRQVMIDESEIDLDEIESLLGQPLTRNYPNPFNPDTRISYFVPTAGHVAIDIYNTAGRHVCNLLDEFVPAGVHTVAWGSRDDRDRPVASGIYFYRVVYDGQTGIARKMVLIK